MLIKRYLKILRETDNLEGVDIDGNRKLKKKQNVK
jgi:hypothetical protein